MLSFAVTMASDSSDSDSVIGNVLDQLRLEDLQELGLDNQSDISVSVSSAPVTDLSDFDTHSVTTKLTVTPSGLTLSKTTTLMHSLAKWDLQHRCHSMLSQWIISSSFSLSLCLRRSK